jgi:hypothetical protein
MTPERQRAVTFHLNEAIRLMEPERTAKNIAGWTVAKSGGYFRAFKKMGGKMKAVYLGKSLDGAEQKIMAKQDNSKGIEQ